MECLLNMLKVDLGIMTATAYDDRLLQIIRASIAAIKREGATDIDTENAEDAQLIVMYAAWLWRRRDTGEGMPRMLRWALNNRIFAKKAASE